MSETWFISDTHFGHENILEYEKEARPFENIYFMNEAIIERWNAVVNEKDTVYHLGDFCFGKHNIELASHLKGKKRLVLGNHDTYKNSNYLQYFEKLYGVKFWEQCVLSHMPVHPLQLGRRWFLNVHGHLHSKRVMWNNTAIITEQENGILIVPPQYDENYFNVSCEQNNLTPINADVIRERVKNLKGREE